MNIKFILGKPEIIENAVKSEDILYANYMVYEGYRIFGDNNEFLSLIFSVVDVDYRIFNIAFNFKDSDAEMTDLEDHEYLSINNFFTQARIPGLLASDIIQTTNVTFTTKLKTQDEYKYMHKVYNHDSNILYTVYFNQYQMAAIKYAITGLMLLKDPEREVINSNQYMFKKLNDNYISLNDIVDTDISIKAALPSESKDSIIIIFTIKGQDDIMFGYSYDIGNKSWIGKLKSNIRSAPSLFYKSINDIRKRNGKLFEEFDNKGFVLSIFNSISFDYVSENSNNIKTDLYFIDPSWNDRIYFIKSFIYNNVIDEVLTKFLINRGFI